MTCSGAAAVIARAAAPAARSARPTAADDLGVVAERRVQRAEDARHRLARASPAASGTTSSAARVRDRRAEPAQVAHPGGEHAGGALGQPARRPLRPQHGHDADRQLLRAVGGDPVQAVAHARVREAVEQRGPVGGEVVGRLVEVRARPRTTTARASRGTSSSATASATVAWPRIDPGVGEQRVGAVEQPQLAVLERLDVVGERRAGVLPARPPGRERAAEHPFAERLGDDRRAVVDARCASSTAAQVLRAWSGA